MNAEVNLSEMATRLGILEDKVREIDAQLKPQITSANNHDFEFVI